MSFSPAEDHAQRTVRSLNSPMQSNLAEMSPVTGLAFNLESLSAKLSTTPCRRISWSDPSPCRPSVCGSSQESPFCTDSPMFQEGVLRGLQPNVRQNRQENLLQVARKFHFSSEATKDKENIVKEELNVSKQSVPERKSKALNTYFDADSGDSGYSGSDKSSTSSFGSQISVPTVRSSVFTDDETEDGFENIFETQKLVDSDGPNLSRSMSHLLTKPLSVSGEDYSSSSCSVDYGTAYSRKHKLPIRRCLSLVMEKQFKEEMSPILSSKVLVGGKCETLSNCVASNTLLDTDSNNNTDDPMGEETALKLKKPSFKRPEPPDSFMTPLQSKRRKSSPSITIPRNSEALLANKPLLLRCYSESAATIMRAVQKSDQQPDLIGDCTRHFALPLVKGRHQDLKTISPQTLAGLIEGDYSKFVTSYTVVDCRYPYEYEGGHIQGAKNIYTPEDIFEFFLNGASLSEEKETGDIIVFHCEFSSERAPKLLRFLRNKDREINEESYPRLHHPEVYILDGGYKAFFENFEDFCEPQTYKPMLHKDHSCDLRHFRAKSKSWSGDSKARAKFRSGLKF